MRVTFYYVRHGQTLFNKIRRLQGSCDSPLTEQGIREAEKAAEALRSVPFTRAYCSSSERAVDTAAIILKERSLKAEPMKGLKEFDFGLMDGALIEQVKPEMTERRKKIRGRISAGMIPNPSRIASSERSPRFSRSARMAIGC